MTLLVVYETYFEGVDDDLDNLVALFSEDHGRKPRTSTELADWYLARVKDYAVIRKNAGRQTRLNPDPFYELSSLKTTCLGTPVTPQQLSLVETPAATVLLGCEQLIQNQVSLCNAASAKWAHRP